MDGPSSIRKALYPDRHDCPAFRPKLARGGTAAKREPYVGALRLPRLASRLHPLLPASRPCSARTQPESNRGLLVFEHGGNTLRLARPGARIRSLSAGIPG